MKTKLLLITVTAFINAYLLNEIEIATSISSDLLIYGTVTTEDDESYTGQIRWGKEEALWFDYFNSSKPENEFLDYLSEDEIASLNDEDYSIIEKTLFNTKKYSYSWNSSGDKNHIHSFACQFGDIKSIDVNRREKVTVTLKNGEELYLKGGSNDIGAKVQIHDESIGMIKLDWGNIRHVEFKKTPSQMESAFGAPLYGKVITEQGTFDGYLQWDHDERMAKDELNGKYEDGELDIEFGNIKSIKKSWRGSEVTLQSGRKFELRGSNDVDDENRGIIVNMPGVGRVDIDWDEFEEIIFTEAPAKPIITYDDFHGEKELRASVKTEYGTSYSGHIVFDLDESYQLEILNGMNKDIEYFIPFSNVKSITPRSKRGSSVSLRNGSEIYLDDKVDVENDNDGILVFENGRDNDAVYITWDEIEKITFE